MMLPATVKLGKKGKKDTARNVSVYFCMQSTLVNSVIKFLFAGFPKRLFLSGKTRCILLTTLHYELEDEGMIVGK